MQKKCSNFLTMTAAMLCIAGTHAIAQVRDTIHAKHGVEVYVHDERSADMTIIAQAQLFKLECSTGDAFRVGAGIEGDYFMPKLLSFHGEYNKSYFNLQKMDVADLNHSANSVKGFSILELGGRFHFVDKKGKAKHKIVLSSNTDYVGASTVTTEHYIKPKLPCRKILAVRGGLYRTTAPVSTAMNKEELSVRDEGAVKTKDGTVFSNVYFTNDHTTGVYIGLSQIINMSVHTTNNVSEDDGSKFFTSLFREVYLDALLASTTFDPIISGGKSYAIEPNAKGSFQTSNIGWRLGKKMVFTRRTLNMGFSFECGSRPGVKGRGGYFSSGWYIAFVK